ncbi:MAG: methyltransferase family protein, partial [Tepidiformaceae bacterium]
RRSIATSTRPFDWIIAAGGWLSLLARPADAPNDWAASMGIGLQTVGLVLTIIGFAYLGRSFGVVAANRGLKVGGPYRFVRHPIYLSHTLTTTGFVLANFSPWNVAVLVLLTGCQVLRMRAEERVLTESGPYAEYAARVRWRLVPGLY